jgi:chemosensory pili system protein ChpA (sensor histidine kinase/response regulator)
MWGKLQNYKGGRMRSRKVVIINDDRRSLGDLEAVLAANGHYPVVVHNALIAVDIVVLKKPDVILLELKMPRKNGFEIAEEINHVFETEKIPIIAMSASFKDEFRFLLNLCGIKGYLKKPLNPSDVLRAIENVTGERN